MNMTAHARKLVLTIHVTSSLGWFGAVACFLALAVAGLIGQTVQLVRAAYLAMELTAWLVIVPLSLVSLLSGVVQSLGTRWGLFQHYWVVIKLLITVLATVMLLLHMQPTGRLASVAAQTAVFAADLNAIRLQLVVDAAAALVVLLVTTVLAVYKPPGATGYGRRKGLG